MRYAATPDDLTALLTGLGQPKYRVEQLWKGLYDERRPLEAITNLSKGLRTQLDDALPLALAARAEHTASDHLTTKWLWACSRDGAEIETVLMRYPTRATVCVSSQAGCAMGCTFCATGQAGFDRHLDDTEIFEQVIRAQHASPQRVGNVVFMGMGEPLANYDAVWTSVQRLHRDLGISARHITISTVGIAPAMRRLADEALPVTLAVSLHAPTDALREQLVPLNRRYPLAEIMDAARAFAAAKGRRVTFEYACIGGVNDEPHHADTLARLLRGFGGAGGTHVNIIPLNPTAGFEGHAPSHLRVQAFAARLRAAGINATVRRNRGVDIDAACGQLRSRHQIEPSASAADPPGDPASATMAG
jgi:23S rRNA (adenine2503-C2)-methyltransferase